MPLADGCHHVALVTEDLDRFLDFWVPLFDADVRLDLTEGHLRHAMVDLGGGFSLHPFELADDDGAATAALPTIFERGHLDHLAIAIEDPTTFDLVRRRLVEVGACDGTLVDFGSVRSVWFEDPDGMGCEIAQWADAPARTLDEATRTPLVVG